jgi:hypothetical protein
MDNFVQFSSGYNKRLVKIGPVLGWLVPAEIDHSKTILLWFSDVYSMFITFQS